MMWHPASLLLSWLAFAVGLAALSLPALLVVSLSCLVLAVVAAPQRTVSLLRRSRWLLLSLAILFLFFSPGEYLPGLPGRLGLTHEGVRQCAEQLGRLLALLTSLALLHQRLGTDGLLTGFYWLLRPIPWRDATVVRLMLVMEFVERKERIGWRDWLAPEHETGPDCLRLPMPPPRGRDRLLIGLLLAGFLGWAIWA